MSRRAVVRFVERLLDDEELQAEAVASHGTSRDGFAALSQLAAERGYEFTPREAVEFYGTVTERFAGVTQDH